MQFKDETKKYEIVFVGIRNKGVGSEPLFQMRMEKPVKAEGYFEAKDIKTQEGKTGITMSKYTKIAEAMKAKNGVLIIVPDEIIDYIRKTHEEEIEKLKQEAQEDPENWRWSTGCDTGNLYIAPDRELMFEFRKDLREISDVIEKEHKFDAYKLFGREEEKSLVSHETVMKIYNSILEKKAKEEADKKARRENKEKPIFEKAKETGKPQILECFAVECSDPHEECDADQVIIYAMPDGSKKRTQNHTW